MSEPSTEKRVAKHDRQDSFPSTTQRRSFPSRWIGGLAALLILVLLAALLWIAAGFGSGPGEGIAAAWRQSLVEFQRQFHEMLIAAIRAVQAEQRHAFWNLLGLGFLYGIFHAAGPGHGKVVISTYLATSGGQLSRGLSLTAVSSALQGVTAIVLVEATLGLMGLTFRDARTGTAWLEAASYGLVTALGLAILVMAARRLWHLVIERKDAEGKGMNMTPSRLAENGHPAEGEHHGHGHAHDHGEHRGGHDHAHCHHHGVDASAMAAPLGPGRFLGIALSVGIRPCTGAVLILLFAITLDLRLAGYGAVLGMSAGVAITVGLLAMLAVYARRTALSLITDTGNGSLLSTRMLSLALQGLAALGGIFIALIGTTLLGGALRMSTHPLL